MGLFSTYKPRITKEEFANAVNHLSGLSQKEREFVREFFEGALDLNSRVEDERGIDAAELDQLMASLRESTETHHMSEDKLKVIDRVFRRFI